jgi:hypothetical protein
MRGLFLEKGIHPRLYFSFVNGTFVKRPPHGKTPLMPYKLCMSGFNRSSMKNNLSENKFLSTSVSYRLFVRGIFPDTPHIEADTLALQTL